jgi:hypothetical protein
MVVKERRRPHPHPPAPIRHHISGSNLTSTNDMPSYCLVISFIFNYQHDIKSTMLTGSGLPVCLCVNWDVSGSKTLCDGPNKVEPLNPRWHLTRATRLNTRTEISEGSCRYKWPVLESKCFLNMREGWYQRQSLCKIRQIPVFCASHGRRSVSIPCRHN